MKQYTNWSILALGAMTLGMAVASCEDEPNKFELTGGTPTIKFIRPQDAAAKDSLLTSAFTGSGICIVGENLTSIREMWFNDVQAVLNTSYITSNTMLVTVPKDIPASNTGKIYMITSGNDTVSYDFGVQVPAPSVASMVCEWTGIGDKAVIRGQYFVNDPNQPLTVTFTGIQNSCRVQVPAENIIFVDQSAVSFIVPDNAEEGQIEIETIYGKGVSKFYFHDSRNIITDFDGENHAGRGTGIVPQGWNLKPTYRNEGGIDGYYCQIGPADTEGGWVEDLKLSFWCGNWNGDPMSIKMGEAGVPLRNCFDFSDWQNMSLKFELCIPEDNPWSAGALQILFVNNEQCANDSWQNNTYIHTSADGGLDLPRALYNPWAATGSFHTNGEWITVTIPLTDFVYNDDGTKAPSPMNPTSFDSFIMWPINGGVQGTACTPIFLYDNIRVVPNL